MIKTMKEHSEELYGIIMTIFNDSLKNDGKIDIFDYIYTSNDDRGQIHSIWNAMIRKSKIEKVLKNIEDNGEV